MDLDELIAHLRNVRANYPGCSVVIGTPSQVLHRRIPGMNAGFRLPIADGACLGDQDGETSSLFIVTKREV